MYKKICQTDLSEFHSTVWEKLPYGYSKFCSIDTHTQKLIHCAAIFTIPYRNYYSPHSEWISLNSMGKIAKGVKKINFTMLYGNYCYIIIENFSKKFSPCICPIQAQNFSFFINVTYFFSRPSSVVLLTSKSSRQKDVKRRRKVQKNCKFVPCKKNEQRVAPTWHTKMLERL